MKTSVRRGKLLRSSALIALLVAGAASSASAADPTYQFDIPAESLSQALTDFSQASSQQILYTEDLVRDRKSVGLHGTYTAETALNALLAGTDLKVQVNAAGVMMVRPKNAQAASIEAATQGGIETITVTAQKRPEASLDVPMGLTVLTGAQLARAHALRLEDYVGNVPGLNISGVGVTSEVIVRGISIGSGDDVNAAVATYVDETPFTAQGIFGGSTSVGPDLDTFDMQRIEVLKGPQGTLYGANALGGLLKFVTNAPDPSSFAATVQAGLSTVSNGGGGFDLHGMVNVPLADDAALRVVGYETYYPGYIDDPSRGLTNTNGEHVGGGRASVLWEPTDDLSVRLSAFYQRTTAAGSNSEDVNPTSLTPIFGNYIQERLIDEPSEKSEQLYNATVNWNLGFAQLLSSTSYSSSYYHALSDRTAYYGPLFNFVFDLFGGYTGPTVGFAELASIKAKSFTQEVRLSSTDGPLQWLVGGYYTNQNTLENAGFPPIDLPTKTVQYSFPLTVLTDTSRAGYDEYAGFANLDYYITPTIDIAAGGRYAENSQHFNQTSVGLLGSAPIHTTSSQGVFTYSGDARWHITPTDMFYARIAEGFVPGGPNILQPGAAPLPTHYNSSTTLNYEVGFKGSLLDNHLTVEISAFDIDWRDIQLIATVGGFGEITNGGTATSKGVEWAFNYVPIDGLTLGFNGSYDDAYLTQATPASVGGLVGDRLPLSALWATSLSANYERPLFGDYSGFAGVNWRFTGSRLGSFGITGPRQEMPNFSMVDLRAGLETTGWSISLYARNVGDTIAFNNLYAQAMTGNFGPQSAFLYTPRTFGVELSANF